MSLVDMRQELLYLNEKLADLVGRKQYDLNSGTNAWILKPGGKSRGRGIEIHDNLKNLFNSINGSKDTIWIT